MFKKVCLQTQGPESYKYIWHVNINEWQSVAMKNHIYAVKGVDLEVKVEMVKILFVQPLTS